MKPLKTFYNLPKDKQERIIQVAVEEFSDHGFQGTSINTIVGRLGIAKGSIFQYFGDKKGLFVFVFDMSLRKVKDYLRKVRDSSENADLFSRLETTLKAGVEFINMHPLIYRLYLRVLFERQLPYRNDLLLALRKYSHNYLRTLLETAQKRGEIRDEIDPNMAGFILDAVMDRFLQAQAIEHLDAGLGIFQIKPDDARSWIEHIVNIMRFGLER